VRDPRRNVDRPRAAIYARVSTKEQEEGYSIASQLELLRAYCAANGIEVVSEFVEAETAKEAGRRMFGEMLDLARRGGIAAIVVEKTDRLCRNLKDRVSVDDLDLAIHLVKEGEVISKDSRSHAKFVHDIKLVLSKNYIDNLSEETRKGMLQKARQGIHPTKAPFERVSGWEDRRARSRPGGTGARALPRGRQGPQEPARADEVRLRDRSAQQEGQPSGQERRVPHPDEPGLHRGDGLARRDARGDAPRPRGPGDLRTGPQDPLGPKPEQRGLRNQELRVPGPPRLRPLRLAP